MYAPEYIYLYNPLCRKNCKKNLGFLTRENIFVAVSTSTFNEMKNIYTNVQLMQHPKLNWPILIPSLLIMNITHYYIYLLVVTEYMQRSTTCASRNLLYFLYIIRKPSINVVSLWTISICLKLFIFFHVIFYIINLVLIQPFTILNNVNYF